MRKVKLISKKGLTKHLINKYKILNGLKYFFEDRSQKKKKCTHPHQIYTIYLFRNI